MQTNTGIMRNKSNPGPVIFRAPNIYTRPGGGLLLRFASDSWRYLKKRNRYYLAEPNNKFDLSVPRSYFRCPFFVSSPTDSGKRINILGGGQPSPICPFSLVFNYSQPGISRGLGRELPRSRGFMVYFSGGYGIFSG